MLALNLTRQSNHHYWQSTQVLLFLNQVSWTYSGQVKTKSIYRHFWKFSPNQVLIFCLATAFNAFIKLPYSREKVKPWMNAKLRTLRSKWKTHRNVFLRCALECSTHRPAQSLRRWTFWFLLLLQQISFCFHLKLWSQGSRGAWRSSEGPHSQVFLEIFCVFTTVPQRQRVTLYKLYSMYKGFSITWCVTTSWWRASRWASPSSWSPPSIPPYSL